MDAARGVRGAATSCRRCPRRPSCRRSPACRRPWTPRRRPRPGVDPAALEFLAAGRAVEAHRLLAEALAAGHEQQAVSGVDAGSGRGAAGRGRARPGAVSTARRRVGARPGGGWRRPCGPGGTAARPRCPCWRRSGCRRARRSHARVPPWTRPGTRTNGRQLRAPANRWTVVGAPAQLRLGRDGRWWPYRKERGRWVPAGGAAQDPATALASVTAPASAELAPEEGNSL